MNQDNRIYVIIAIIGIIPVIWLAILIAPIIDGGLINIINELPSVLNSPFNIQLCENSKKTILIFLLMYGMSIGLYVSTRRNYKKGKEHGSAKWGNARAINKKYKQSPESENRILTQNIRLGLNAKKHRRNLNTLVVGRKSVQVKHCFMQSLIYFKPLIIHI